MTFEDAAQAKFDRGQAEHGDWNDVDPVAELSDELLDLYWYASHPKFPEEHAANLRSLARMFWNLLNNPEV